MTVFVLIREDQNEHGFVDTSITGIFREKLRATEQESREQDVARLDGLIVEDDESSDANWQVSWRIEEHDVS